MTPATSTLGAIAPSRAVTDCTAVGAGVAAGAGFPAQPEHATASKRAQKQANVWRITVLGRCARASAS